jgi:hypothetical protein
MCFFVFTIVIAIVGGSISSSSGPTSKATGSSMPASGSSGGAPAEVGKSTPANATAGAQTPKRVSAAQATPKPEDLEVVSWGWGTGSYENRVIRGTVRNNTQKHYGYVQVEINLYDESGAQVGSTLANVNNLEANGTWRFEAMVLEASAASARLKKVTGF